MVLGRGGLFDKGEKLTMWKLVFRLRMPGLPSQSAGTSDTLCALSGGWWGRVGWTVEVHFCAKLFHLRETGSLKLPCKDTHHMATYGLRFCFALLGFTQQHVNMHFSTTPGKSEPGLLAVLLTGRTKVQTLFSRKHAGNINSQRGCWYIVILFWSHVVKSVLSSTIKKDSESLRRLSHDAFHFHWEQ